MNLQPRTTSLLRIVSVVGILLLLVLQYIWLKNAYKTIEQNLVNQSVSSLKSAVEEDLFYREEHGRVQLEYQKGPKTKIDSETEIVKVQNIDDFKYLLNDCLYMTGSNTNLSYLDSVFKETIRSEFGFVPEYKLSLIKVKKIGMDTTSYSNKNTVKKIVNANAITLIYRVGFEHSIRLTYPSPSTILIHKAKYILFSSILLVLLVGSILIIQFFNLKREEKFSNFIVDYTKMIAHDLQSPIASIRMMLHKLSTTKRMEAAKLAKYYQLSIDQSDKLLFGLNTLLFLALAERQKLVINGSNVDIEMFVEKVCDRVRRFDSEHKKINIKVHMRPERFAFVIDFNLMENVIYNMLDNAVKYSNDLVNITIICERSETGMIMKIRDDGIGMSEAVQKRIFNLFERGSKYDGTLFGGFGIGLTFVYEAIKAHGGKIMVESKEHLGTLFTIHLPSRV